jgi:hypothetical protein
MRSPNTLIEKRRNPNGKNRILYKQRKGEQIQKWILQLVLKTILALAP